MELRATRKRTYDEHASSEMEDTPQSVKVRAKKARGTVLKAEDYPHSEAYYKNLERLLGGKSPILELKFPKNKRKQLLASDAARSTTCGAMVAKIAPEGRTPSPCVTAVAIDFVDMSKSSQTSNENEDFMNKASDREIGFLPVKQTQDDEDDEYTRQILKDLEDPATDFEECFELREELMNKFPSARPEVLRRKANNQAKSGRVDPELMEFLTVTPVQSDGESDSDECDSESEEDRIFFSYSKNPPGILKTLTSNKH